MAKLIWKYQLLKDTQFQQIKMPQDAEILSVQLQYNELVLWALVDNTHLYDTRSFEVQKTGWELSKAQSRKHIDTVQVHGGALIFHIFEVQI